MSWGKTGVDSLTTDLVNGTGVIVIMKLTQMYAYCLQRYRVIRASKDPDIKLIQGKKHVKDLKKDRLVVLLPVTYSLFTRSSQTK